MSLHNARFLSPMKHGAMLAGTDRIQCDEVFQALQVFREGSEFSLEALAFFFKWTPVFKADRCHSCAPNREAHDKIRTRSQVLPPACELSRERPCVNIHGFAWHSCPTVVQSLHQYAAVLSRQFSTDPALAAACIFSVHTENICSSLL